MSADDASDLFVDSQGYNFEDELSCGPLLGDETWQNQEDLCNFGKLDSN